MESCDPARRRFFFFYRSGTGSWRSALALVSIVGTYCYINLRFFYSSLEVTGAVAVVSICFEKSIDYSGEGLPSISGSSFMVRILSMLI